MKVVVNGRASAKPRGTFAVLGKREQAFQRRPAATMSATIPTTPLRSSAAPSRAELLGNSPHYSTTRRHSLYGTEDRIVIDPGSRIWKVGFSGEGRPRDVFVVKHWNLGNYTGKDSLERIEEERVLELELQDRLRAVFFK